jgi:GNAT superfamily N-acetyltransferase
MPTISVRRSTPVARTPRVLQLEGLFDLDPARSSETAFEISLPLEERDWQIGLIVGPSGCGKSTLAKELFGDACCAGFDWPADKSILDAFPARVSIRDITGLLSSVGFSSPPAWRRPYSCLSNGEQFRVTIAKALAEGAGAAAPPVVIDEFTSVVDRTVARVASAAIAKTIRATGASARACARRFVAVTCHYDVIDWLSPDWICDPAAREFQWRLLPETRSAEGKPLRRPAIELEIARVHRKAWTLFKPHHYLSGDLNPAAKCFVAFFEGRPAAFTAVLSHPDPQGGYWREHRSVCLPDYQGVGIGNALSEFVAGMFRATGKRYISVTSHPGMIAHRRRSPKWIMYRSPSFVSKNTGRHTAFNRTAALKRLTAGFRYIGPANAEAARLQGVVTNRPGTR